MELLSRSLLDLSRVSGSSMCREYTISTLALATKALKIVVPDEAVDVRIMKRTLRATATNLILIDSLMSEIDEVSFFEV